jgi:hypothetical protein
MLRLFNQVAVLELGIDEISSKLRQLGQKIQSKLEEIQSDVKRKLNSWKGDAVPAESSSEEQSAGSAPIELEGQCGTTKVRLLASHIAILQGSCGE